MRRDLAGKRVVITGASGGIGRALAEQAVGAGARVIVAARSADKLTDLVHQLAGGPGEVLAVRTDVTSEADRQRLLDTADPGHIEAVLDWDMCTQGYPLADLGYLLNYWVEPGDPPEWREIAAMPTWRDGFPSRAEAIARYAERTGFEVAPVGWHQVFAAFKLAVIIQQIYIRWVRGQTQDPRFRTYGRRVLGLAAKARRLT